MDALTLLHDDHQKVDALFERFGRAGPKASKTRRDVVDRIIRELSIHTAIEEQVFYPAVRAEAPELSSQVLESLEEHHIVKWLLSELERTAPDNDRFDAKVTVLKEDVQHHVEEEEKDLFPTVRRAFTKARLDELGEELRQAKASVPDRPHPRMPDEPPGNVITSVAAGVLDAAKTTAGQLAEQASHMISSSPREANRLEHEARRAAKNANGTVARKATVGARSARKATRKPTTGASKSTHASASKARNATNKATRRTSARASTAATRTRRTAKRATAKSR